MGRNVWNNWVRNVWDSDDSDLFGFGPKRLGPIVWVRNVWHSSSPYEHKLHLLTGIANQSSILQRIYCISQGFHFFSCDESSAATVSASTSAQVSFLSSWLHYLSIIYQQASNLLLNIWISVLTEAHCTLPSIALQHVSNMCYIPISRPMHCRNIWISVCFLDLYGNLPLLLTATIAKIYLMPRKWYLYVTMI